MNDGQIQQALQFLKFIADNYYRLAIVIICLIILIFLVIFIIHLFNHWYLKHREMVWLELTPPASITRTPEATEQLFSVIHGLYAARRFKDKLLGRKPVFSFEIVSTKQDGIRYLIQVEKSLSQSLQKTISAYVSDAKVKQVNVVGQTIDGVIEFKEMAHYIFPLTVSSAIDQHDPLGYITNAMTKLDESEQITMQLILTPVKLAGTKKLARRILSNEDILTSSKNGYIIWLERFSNLINSVLWNVVDTTSEVYRTTTSSNYTTRVNDKDAQFKAQVAKKQRPARTLSAFEQELMESMHQKVIQPLFQASLRILISGSNSKEHMASLRSALDGYSVPLYQALKAKMRLPLIQQYRKSLANKRLPAMTRRSSMILSTNEAASLYHFPSSRISRTDNLITSLSRTLPAPVSLKNNSKLDVVIGENIHHGITTPIGLTELERQRHLYIIGGTGNGKTTMLQYQIVQDMQSGKGICVIDPHGDMAETLLKYVPKERIKDVVYFNPDDLDYPIGLNLLELTEGLSGNDLLREKDMITESVISIFRKIFSDEDSGGHRVEYVLRNAVQTALTVENANLFTVFRLLEDPTYRTSIVKTLEDQNLKSFWNNELGKAGAMQRVKMAAGITAKIGRFLFSASAKQILEQPKSTINFDDIINSDKIFICNFSKGAIGEDTSELFGITVLAKLQLASLKRAHIPQNERRPFYIYVDEFQNFATTSFVQMLSEARKYKVFMIMAEQSTSQQDDQKMVSVILANVGTVVCFRTGNPEDEKLLLPLFSPYIKQGEISNLNAFNYYIRISAITAQEPLSGETLLLENDGDQVIAELAIKASREQYTRKEKIESKTKPNKTINSTSNESIDKKTSIKNKGGLPDQKS